MLTISADISSLSDNQRKSLAGFILDFPKISPTPTPSPAVVTEAIEDSPERAFAAPSEIKSGPQLVVPRPSESNLDKAGLPWDERIHSSSKALTADGLWRKKRGVDDALVSQVETQLKQLMSLPTPAPSAAEIPPPPGPVVVPAPPPALIDGRQAFVNLVGRISASIPLKKISMDEVVQACKDAGVDALPLLANRPDLIPQVAMTIEALIASR